MAKELSSLGRKVQLYKEVLANTITYRKEWVKKLKKLIIKETEMAAAAVELKLETEIRADIENLEAVQFSLGQIRSGMFQDLGSGINRDLIKYNGGLVYQQLFNGKIIVLIQYPFIENYGQPQPPKTIGIFRPNELSGNYFKRHLEELISEVTNWEDYDDDEPNKKVGFELNFGPNQMAEE